jgi:HPt (histidine-containing phosphotransfer) domain-containing protein
MATTSDEIQIDLDEIDASQDAEITQNASKDGKNGAIKAPKPPDEAIEVVQADAGPKTATTTILKPEEGLAKLQKQLADEQAARAEAERRAAAASEAEVKAKTEVQGTQLDLVKNAITTFTSQNATLKAQYAAAAAAGDWDAAAEAQLGMSTNAAKLQALESAKTQLEKAPKPTATVQPDQLEEFASRLTPTSAAWVRAHPEFVREPAKNRKMIRAHEDAIDDGVKADTPEYFEYIEKRLGLATAAPQVQKTEEDALSSAAAPRSQRSAPPSAPVSRSGNGAAPRSNVVKLTADEIEMARLNDMTPEEYARQKLALTREGRLN